jgi:L-lactate dehydrogenase (cytochrome)
MQQDGEMRSTITTIEELRRLGQKRVPKMFYDYVDSGAWTGATYAANEADFQRIKLRQRVAVDLTNRTLATTMVGQPVSMPLALAPTGIIGMQHPDGEIVAARAAAKAGVPYTLSTMSVCSIEDVANNTDQPFWFQLYVMRDREFNLKLIDRAKAAGCSALVLTLDLQVIGQRHKDIRNGLTTPPKITVANILDMATKPRWRLGMARTKRRGFGNIVGHAPAAENMRSLSEWIAAQFDPHLNWDDIKWIRDRWGGKLLLKGILDPEDAGRALETGADALIVSNHGGRQLDGALSSIAALPSIAKTVGDRMEVFMDGGVRSGQDVIKALALGARSVFIGRAFLYGVQAMGGEGVTLALDIIRKELDLTMALCGLRDIKDVDRKIIETRDATREFSALLSR